MELRWFNGKLQYREGVTHDSPWTDVPTVSEEVKEPPQLPTSWDCCNSWTFGNFCGNCGKPRPEKVEKTLEEKFEHELYQCKQIEGGFNPKYWAKMLVQVAKEHYEGKSK